MESTMFKTVNNLTTHGPSPAYCNGKLLNKPCFLEVVSLLNGHIPVALGKSAMVPAQVPS